MVVVVLKVSDILMEKKGICMKYIFTILVFPHIFEIGQYDHSPPETIFNLAIAELGLLFTVTFLPRTCTHGII